MTFSHIAKTLLVLLTLLSTACIHTQNGDANKVELNRDLWLWDDLQQKWSYNNTPFEQMPINPALRVAEEKAISLQINFVKSLNSFNNSPNGLLMKVFQISDSKEFLQATQSTTELQKLLTSETVITEALQVKRLILLPSVEKTLILNRKKDTRYLGIVLGYNNFEQTKVFRLIPLVNLYQPIKPLPEKKTSWLSIFDSSSPTPKPQRIPQRIARLKINLLLGATAIQQLKIQAK